MFGKNILYLLFSMLIFSSCGENNVESVYVIDNDQFNISANKTNPRETTDGINAAIADAKAKGYTSIRLAPGEYLIQSNGNGRWVPPKDGIKIPSNITLDLTNTKIYLDPNHYEYYGMIQMEKVENVIIKNGHLIGDRHQHSFVDSDRLTHEYGYGINLLGAKNIEIRNMKIEGMTGDAVILTTSGFTVEENEVSDCKQVLVTECELFDCRRQGISVVNATDSELSYNKIYNIHGTSPQFGIDIEPESKYGCKTERIKVHHNHISDCVGGISFHGGVDMEAYENYLGGICLIAIYSKQVKIYKNKVTSPGYISASDKSTDICIFNNECNTVVNNSVKTGLFDCSD